MYEISDGLFMFVFPFLFGNDFFLYEFSLVLCEWELSDNDNHEGLEYINPARFAIAYEFVHIGFEFKREYNAFAIAKGLISVGYTTGYNLGDFGFF